MCVFVPYEAVCLVCALSLLLLKHPDSSLDDLILTFLIFCCAGIQQAGQLSGKRTSCLCMCVSFDVALVLCCDNPAGCIFRPSPDFCHGHFGVMRKRLMHDDGLRGVCAKALKTTFLKHQFSCLRR